MIRGILLALLFSNLIMKPWSKPKDGKINKYIKIINRINPTCCSNITGGPKFLLYSISSKCGFSPMGHFDRGHRSLMPRDSTWETLGRLSQHPQTLCLRAGSSPRDTPFGAAPGSSPHPWLHRCATKHQVSPFHHESFALSPHQHLPHQLSWAPLKRAKWHFST